MQILKNKAFHVSIQWNVLVRNPLSLERGGFCVFDIPQSFKISGNHFL
ncbi:hypothetical protein HPSH169_02820 [Helicobacter pylori Shi169]|uniref:Uncharacterized protein n=1 Tax=Helicobacter pylori Shi169 TaxID=1163741 RepID=A0A0E0WAE6_HELPX|nr:hypothetical protein HPSH169_02820 [Helicobacter pylori Shi169]